MEHTFHPLTIEYTRLAIQDMLLEARYKVIRDYTCLDIKYKVKEDLILYATDMDEQTRYHQLTLLGDTLVELAKVFCDEYGIEYAYSFVTRHIDIHSKHWAASHRECDACIAAGEHSIRVAWLLHLQDDMGA